MVAPAPNSKPGSLDDYVNLFSKRYHGDKIFRSWVHSYTHLSGFDKLKLNFGRYVAKSWYDKRCDSLIHDYASQVFESQKKKDEIACLKEEADKAEALLKQKQQDLDKINRDKVLSEEQALWAEQRQRDAIAQAEREHQETLAQLDAEESHAREVIAANTNVNQIVADAVKERIDRCPFIFKDKYGDLKFDEEAVVTALSNKFLDEIVEGIERDDGRGGFFARTKNNYEGAVMYYGRMQGTGQLKDVHWGRSLVESRKKGFRRPVYPYLVAGQREEKSHTKLSLDTAIIVDKSGSMAHNHRLEMARKAGLALTALMRRENPRNNTYLAAYSDEVTPFSYVDFFRNMESGGCTRTDLALKWLLSTLKGKGPSIAYLLTDGCPYRGYDEDITEETCRAASEFRQYPEIMLRIIFIDPDKASEEKVRRVGRAAGPRTRFMPVTNYQVGGELIRDISQAFYEMQDI